MFLPEGSRFHIFSYIMQQISSDNIYQQGDSLSVGGVFNPWNQFINVRFFLYHSKTVELLHDDHWGSWI